MFFDFVFDFVVDFFFLFCSGRGGERVFFYIIFLIFFLFLVLGERERDF